MKIIVCVKSVLVKAPEGKTVRSLDRSDLNPFDRPALWLAAKLKGETGGSVIALTMCSPEAGGDALMMAMALGADRGVLVCDRALAGADTLATSRALAAAIAKLAPFDLVVFGARTLDSDTGHVGPQTAESLGLPYVGHALAATGSGRTLIVDRLLDGYRERYEADLPAAISVLPRAAPVIDAPLYGIEDAYARAEYETIDLAGLGLAPETVGLAGSPTRVAGTRTVKRERKCLLLPGSIEEQADALARRLIEDGALD